MVAQYGNAVADDLMADPLVRRQPLAQQQPGVVERPWQRNTQVRRAPNAAGLYDVLDLILDKGIVIDAFVRVSLVGIELVTVDLRVVIASVDTYLRYAEGVERLNVDERSGSKKLPDMVGSGVQKGMMAHGVKKLSNAMGGDDDEGEGDEGGQKKGLAGALTHGVRHILQKGVGGILHNVKGDSEEDADDDGRDAGDDGGDEAEARKERHGRDREGRGQEDRGNRGRNVAKSGSRR